MIAFSGARNDLRGLVALVACAGKRFYRRMKQREHFAGLKSPLLDHLEPGRAPQTPAAPVVSKKARRKMSQGLVPEDQPFLDSINAGIMDANGMNMCEILNEAISQPSFDSKAHDMYNRLGLCIDDVVETRDRGRVIAYWSADEIDSFLLFAKEQDKVSISRLTKQIKNNVTSLLQNLEPRFRAELIRKMDFRRVPKIAFEPKKEDRVVEADSRQQFLIDNISSGDNSVTR
jgi:hypothetical protein